jgi:cobalt/nickel transport system ATP-binding protein
LTSLPQTSTPQGKWNLIGVLDSLPVTRVIVSHDLELVEALCQRVVILDKGQVVADGLTKDILADKKLLAEHGLAMVGQS